ncbi:MULTISPECIES: hypothetical protein [unclassified Streptomyces]|uniref:hypothetical protein n=1 Tax=unclassified Streptomyces TaxID=2593676 RepID=UPI00224EC42C|nr:MULTISPECIES: hypothetical protein [unclassified Streptomyces]MCX5054034.1 hypothetical protein [Streptomyces sp. NBC_00474]
MLAFGYRFLGRSVEDANLEIEDLTSINGGLLVWLPEDKTHDEEQNLVLLDRPDIQLVPRLTRWLDYMADQGITTGPVFRHVLRSGKVASAETQGKTAMARGGERAVRQDSRAQPRCGVGLTRHPGALGCRLGSCFEARTDSRTACRVLREMPGLEPLGVPVVFLDVVAWPDLRPSRLAHGERDFPQVVADILKRVEDLPPLIAEVGEQHADRRAAGGADEARIDTRCEAAAR